jgi:hypothetical protein
MFYFCSVLRNRKDRQMNRIGTLAAAVLALALAACAPAAGLGNGNAAVASEAVELRTVTALSLAELAYNSGEAAATAAVRSGALSPAQDATIGAAVHRARALRDQARVIAAAGGDASAAIESLDESLRRIAALSQPAQQ